MGRASGGPGPHPGHAQGPFGPQFEGIRRQRGRGGPWGGPMGPGFGPPPWVQQLLGNEFGRHGRPGGQRGPRVRRGDVRSAILDVLAEEPRNGYQVIQQIGDRSHGAWSPSPGSVYPTIQQLEDEGLVEGFDDGGKRMLRLTDEGRTYVADHQKELAAVWAPFADADEAESGEAANFKQVIGQTMSAVWQLAVSGTPEQQHAALAILADTRRRLYGLLAEGPEGVRDENDPADTEDDEEQ